MDSAMLNYAPGAVVIYSAPMERKACQINGVLPSHPVVIVSTQTLPSNTVQAFTITSSSRYYGYKIFMNSALHYDTKISTIVCTAVHTIEKKFLKDIIGFISPRLLRKCLDAYLFELGLSDNIPEYYQSSPEALKFINAGDPNIPENPLFLPLNGFSGTVVATDTRMQRSGISNIPVVDPIRISLNENDMDEMDNSHDAFLPASNLHAPDVDDVNNSKETDEEKPSSKIVPSVELGETRIKEYKVYKVFSIDTKNFIEEREKSIDAIPSEINVTDDMAFRIFICQVTQAEIVRLGMAKTPYTAKKIIRTVLHHIRARKNELINGVCAKTIDIRFLPARYNLAFRCMTVDDIRSFHMGTSTYMNYAKGLGIESASTYIGKCNSM